MLDHSSDHLRVPHKHYSDRYNVGRQMEGHHRKVQRRVAFRKGGRCRDAQRKGDQCRNNWRTDQRSGHRIADLGKERTDGHNKDRHRAEVDDQGNRAPQVFSSGWTGLVCTPLVGRQSCHGRSRCRFSVQGPPATFCTQSCRLALPARASSSPARRPRLRLFWAEGLTPSSSCNFPRALC